MGRQRVQPTGRPATTLDYDCPVCSARVGEPCASSRQQKIQRRGHVQREDKLLRDIARWNEAHPEEPLVPMRPEHELTHAPLVAMDASAGPRALPAMAEPDRDPFEIKSDPFAEKPEAETLESLLAYRKTLDS